MKDYLTLQPGWCQSPNEITSDHIVIKRIDGSIENIIDYKLKLIR